MRGAGLLLALGILWLIFQPISWWLMDHAFSNQDVTTMYDRCQGGGAPLDPQYGFRTGKVAMVQSMPPTLTWTGGVIPMHTILAPDWYHLPANVRAGSPAEVRTVAVIKPLDSIVTGHYVDGNGRTVGAGFQKNSEVRLYDYPSCKLIAIFRVGSSPPSWIRTTGLAGFHNASGDDPAVGDVLATLPVRDTLPAPADPNSPDAAALSKAEANLHAAMQKQSNAELRLAIEDYVEASVPYKRNVTMPPVGVSSIDVIFNTLLNSGPFDEDKERSRILQTLAPAVQTLKAAGVSRVTVTVHWLQGRFTQGTDDAASEEGLGTLDLTRLAPDETPTAERLRQILTND